ncbi:MAG: hypothetical protein IK111_11175 [Lachnospiraceae bacterium]|nr:hypothetical protein [Lachnospiraceae bacterium]
MKNRLMLVKRIVTLMICMAMVTDSQAVFSLASEIEEVIISEEDILENDIFDESEVDILKQSDTEETGHLSDEVYASKDIEISCNNEDGICSAVLNTSADIPDDAVYFEGNYYKIYTTPTISHERNDPTINYWVKAEEACEKKGGHLCTITSQEEESFIDYLLNYNNPGDSYCLWLGARIENDKWSWVTGEEFNYTHWLPSEPNDSDLFGRKPESCLGIYFHWWYDFHPNNKEENNGYICEWEGKPHPQEVVLNKKLLIDSTTPSFFKFHISQKERLFIYAEFSDDEYDKNDTVNYDFSLYNNGRISDELKINSCQQVKKKKLVFGGQELEEGTYYFTIDDGSHSYSCVKNNYKLTISTTELVPSIPDDAVYFEGSYYKIYNEQLGWDEARERCESYGGHLCTITSSDEQEFVGSMTALGAWLGGYYDGDEWKWVTDEEFDYTCWNYNEPSNGDGKENCLALYLRQWSDFPNRFNDVTNFICEWNIYPKPKELEEDKVYYIDPQKTCSFFKFRCNENERTGRIYIYVEFQDDEYPYKIDENNKHSIKRSINYEFSLIESYTKDHVYFYPTETMNPCKTVREGECAFSELLVPGKYYFGIDDGSGRYSCVKKPYRIIISTIPVGWVKADFVMGEDSNSYEHSESSFPGKYDLDDKYFNTMFAQKLKNGGEKSEILRTRNEGPSGGVCYGATLSMGLVNDRVVRVTDISDGFKKTPENYYNLEDPIRNGKLYQTMVFYHLSQLVDDGILISEYNKQSSLFTDNSINLKLYLEDLIKCTYENKLCMLGINAGYSLLGIGNKLEHAVLITGCEYNLDEEKYIIRICDINTYKVNDPEDNNFVYMTIKRDCDDFEIELNGHKYNKSNVHSLNLFDWRKSDFYPDSFVLKPYITLTGNLNQSQYNSKSNTKYNNAIIFESNTSFKLSDANGRLFQYDKGEIVNNNFDINSLKTIYSGNDSSYKCLKTGFSSRYQIELESNNADFRVLSGDKYLAFDGNNIEAAEIDLEDGLTIKGNDYSFEGYINSYENDYKLASISGKATDDVKIGYKANEVIVTSDKDITNIKIKTFVDNDVDERELDDDDRVEITFAEDLRVDGIDESGYKYSGKQVKPDVKIYDGINLLKEKTDYTLVYKNNTKAYTLTEDDAGFDPKKAPCIIITGKGNYSSKDTIYFKILPLDIEGEEFDADDITIATTGKKQNVNPVLRVDVNTLKSGRDFGFVIYKADDVGYNNPLGTTINDAGNYIVRMTGKGNYKGNRNVNLIVTSDYKAVGSLSTAKLPGYKYTGGPITPEPVVKDGKKKLEKDIHYTLMYQNNTKVGTGYVIIMGKPENGYAGIKRVSFKIIGCPIKKAKITGIPQSVVYTGNEITIDDKISVTAGEELTLGTDYSISYKNNLNAGIAEFTLTGKGEYTGAVSGKFKISPFDMSLGSDTTGRVNMTCDATAEYSKGGAVPKVSVSFIDPKGIMYKLTEGIDYTLSYENNNSVNEKNTPAVYVNGKGNFKGKKNAVFEITTKDLSRVTLHASDKVYKNKVGSYLTTVGLVDTNGKKLDSGKDYEKRLIYSYVNNTEVMVNGSAVTRAANDEVGSKDIIPENTIIKVTATAKGENYTGTTSGTFKITKMSLAKATVKVPTQVYSGKPITIAPEKLDVKIKGVKLIPYDSNTGKGDFEIISYSNNTNKGVASIVIQGRGNYGGMKTQTFKIQAKKFVWPWRLSLIAQ